jgi:hypothetical protein
MSNAYRESKNIASIPLPPFGKSLDESNSCIRIHLASSESWARCWRENAIGYRDLLLLPDDKAPEELRWPVSGKDALVFDSYGAENSRLRGLCVSLREYGVNNILVLRSGNEPHVMVAGERR